MIRTANIAVPLALMLAASACGDNGRGMRGEASGDGAVASAPQRYADEDNDGRVTRDEAVADPYLQASFDRFDANDDDALDRAEFSRLEAQSASRKASPPEEERHQLRDKRDFPKSY